MRFISIDPSINYCGYAIFDKGKLIDSGLFNPKPLSKDYMEKSRDIAALIKFTAENAFVDRMVIEKPAVYKTMKGYAATESESIQKLYFCVGVICGLVSWRIKQILIPAMKWKGQLPKQVTIERVNKKHGTNFKANTVSNNIADAVGIGDWYIKYRKERRRKK